MLACVATSTADRIFALADLCTGSKLDDGCASLRQRYCTKEGLNTDMPRLGMDVMQCPGAHSMLWSIDIIRRKKGDLESRIRTQTFQLINAFKNHISENEQSLVDYLVRLSDTLSAVKIPYTRLSLQQLHQVDRCLPDQYDLALLHQILLVDRNDQLRMLNPVRAIEREWPLLLELSSTVEGVTKEAERRLANRMEVSAKYYADPHLKLPPEAIGLIGSWTP